jgi:muconolactone D-isomerase
MEFLVRLTPSIPESLTAAERETLFAAERARGTELLEQRKMVRMWRLPATASALLLWEVAGPEELHELITSMPVSKYCDVEVTPVIQHPLETAWKETER